MMPGRLRPQPAIYCLTRKSRNAFNLLREYLSDDIIRSHLIAPGSIQHLLGINEIRVRVLRAAQELGLTLAEWQRSEDLAKPLEVDGLIPDGFFKLQRIVDGQVRTAAFFLELQRANRSKAVMKSKLNRYRRLYDSGRFQDIFGTRALRVLFVFESQYGTNINHRMADAIGQAKDLDIALIRCTSLDQVRQTAPTEFLTENIWHDTRNDQQTALYQFA
jgi:hypothetical protein